MMRLSLLLLLCLRASSAQPLQVGGFAQGGFDLHQTSFQALPGTFSCSPGFSSAIGRGIGLGAIASLPTWSFELPAGLGRGVPTFRLAYEQRSAAFRTREQQPIALDSTIAHATIEHRASVEFSAIAVQLGAALWVQPTIFFEPSLSISFPLRSHFEQGEYLVEPADRGRFRETGTRERNRSSGTLGGVAALDPAVMMTAGWSHGAERSFQLRPELSVRLPIGSTMAAFPWQMFSLRAGVSILFALPDRHESRPPPPQEPPAELESPPQAPTPDLPALVVDVHAIGLDTADRERRIDTISVHIRQRRHIRPLLPYVFFEEGSAEIPQRYIRLRPEERVHFDESELASYSTLEAYYHLLNIIGSRMRKRPSAQLLLTGCTMGVGSESNRLDLAWQRAASIRTYLHTVWGIDTARIRISARNLPARPSMVGHPDGNAENARVEISSTDPAITDPVVGTETQWNVDPRKVALRLMVSPIPARWDLHVRYGDSLILARSGTAAPPPRILLPAQWHMFPAGIVDIELSAHCPHAVPPERSITRHVAIVPRTDTVQSHYERFSLILFDFDDATIPPSQQSLIDVLTSHITPSTRITITGYTDRMGDRQHNLRLAERRASALARTLGVLGRATITAVGSNELLYDNSLPEGRFYSRTIEIELEH